MTVFVGLDIGGTKVMVAAADREGNILRRREQTHLPVWKQTWQISTV